MAPTRTRPTTVARSLWLTATWTGFGAAVVCAVLSIVAVAICWLPVSGSGGHTISAIRAGLLTFLAALHGGITIDGTAAQFVPLGMTLIVMYTAWRAGSGLADAASDVDDPVRLLQAGAVQAGSFTVACLVAVPFAHLGTSSVPLLGVGAGALILFTATGGIAFIRGTALGPLVGSHVPELARRGARVAAAALATYLAAGALLVAASLVWHHRDVTSLSAQVGDGWGGVPVLLLGVLAAPNAVIAGSSYLLGPGFAVGSGASVSAFTTAHGVVPAFPILGALPRGHGATWPAWSLMAATALAVSVVTARTAWRSATWRGRFLDLTAAAAVAGVAMAVLAWQGGGAIGDGRLHVVGASPWLTALLLSGELAVLGALGLGVAALARRVRRPAGDERQRLATAVTVQLPELRVVREQTDGAGAKPDEASDGGKLAG